MKLLIVEDEHKIAGALKRGLEQEAFAVDLAYDGDEGPGIAEADLARIFERFYRADKSRTNGQATGYGLGLALAKKIVGLHKGRLSAKNTPGKGSTFTIKLPLG